MVLWLASWIKAQSASREPKLFNIKVDTYLSKSLFSCVCGHSPATCLIAPAILHRMLQHAALGAGLVWLGVALLGMAFDLNNWS